MLRNHFILLLLSIVFFVSSCATVDNGEKTKIKNVIFMIGDGMGPQQLSLLYHYAKNAPHSIYEGESTIFEKLALNGVGLHVPAPYNKIVIDSAASATHMATGKISRNGMIGLDHNGHVAETILEQAKKAGLSTGLISDTRITHATPASYAAHVISRKMESEIAEQMLETAPDLLLSGGLKFFIPKNAKNKKSSFYQKYRMKIPTSMDLASRRTDKLDLLSRAEKKGYELSFDRVSFMNSDSKKILGIFSSDAMPKWYLVYKK